MPLGVYLTLDQDIIYNGNYSDVSGFKLTGTIYSDKERTTAMNLTGYTLTMSMYKNESFLDHFNQACTITVAASGTFYISVTSGTLPFSGLYNVVISLTKSGTKVTTLNRQELLIQRGPQ
jgi:hypothetical protein